MGVGALACAACAGMAPKPDDTPQSFYTVTAEIALTRHEPRVAALQYAAAAEVNDDLALLARATEVSALTLQPSVTMRVAARWIGADPHSLDAERAAASAALLLDRIPQSAAHFRIVLTTSPSGTDAEFARLETELTASENIFGARQVADRLAAFFPSSAAALRLQGFAAMRADDPAAAARSFAAALAREAPGVDAGHRELAQALARAQIMAGDAEGPLAAAKSALEQDDTPANRLDYVLLLMTARRDSAAVQQLEIVAQSAEFAPVALRLLGMIEFQQGHLDVAASRFAALLRTQKDPDDAFYYLGLIADRHDEPEQALRWYAQVQSGENALPALLRITNLLHKHGEAAAAEELLDGFIEDQPQHEPEILDARARMYADSGDVPRALAVLERGVTEYPDSVELRYAMASTYEEHGQLAAALRELQNILKARPDDPSAMNALGYTLADHSRELARARRLIERAHTAAPKNAAILDSLGWVLYRQGHATDAESYLREAYADDGGGDIAAHLGEVLWQLGKPADAERIWSTASAADADNRLLRATRQRLHAARPAAPTEGPRPSVY
jgi:tetratricopeptide (TPR) repeat protein